MDIFDWALINPVTGQPYLQTEYTLHTSPPLAANDPSVILDKAGLRYAQSEVIAFHVLSMNVRLFCLPQKQTSETSEAFVEAGFATGNPPAGNPASLTDTTMNWNGPPLLSFAADNLRIYAGTGASQWSTVTNNTANTVALTPCPPALGNLNLANWYTLPDATSQYRIDGTLAALTGAVPPSSPGWYQRGNYNFFGPTYRPPAIVEVTLEMTDVRATCSFIFTQRFYIPASER